MERAWRSGGWTGGGGAWSGDSSRAIRGCCRDRVGTVREGSGRSEGVAATTSGGHLAQRHDVVMHAKKKKGGAAGAAAAVTFSARVLVGGGRLLLSPSFVLVLQVSYAHHLQVHSSKRVG